MPPLPTLLRKGFLISDKEDLSGYVGIDYILDKIDDLLPRRRGTPPKIRAQSIGERVIVLKSSTGSGKSTVLPPRMYTRFGDRVGKNFVITQPRKLTTVEIATDIPNYDPRIKLDVNIGYSTSSHKRLPREKGIIFCTVGTITQQLTTMTAQEFMGRYAVVMIDEVHERSLETDTCLFLMKQLLLANFEHKECPLLILMSATFDERVFLRYFEVPEHHYIQVEGQTFPKTVHWPRYHIRDAMQYAVLQAQRIHLSELADLVESAQFKDILIFVHTSKKVSEMAILMHRFNSKIYNGQPLSLEALDGALAKLAVHGGDDGPAHFVLPVELTSASFERAGTDYRNLFANLASLRVPIWANEKDIAAGRPPTKYVSPSRRVIIATNVAETGITIDTLKYCIDTGYVWLNEFNPELDCSMMLERPITQSMSTQRKGRVGRKAPGDWYPCYTNTAFEALQPNQFANIIVEDVSNVLLAILQKNADASLEASPQPGQSGVWWQMHRLNDASYYSLTQGERLDFSKLDFLELPSADALNYSTQKLYSLGFLDAGLALTPFGYFANMIPFLTLEAKRMIFSGYAYNVNILELITIACLVEVRWRNLVSKQYSLPAELNLKTFLQQELRCGFIEMLLVFEAFQAFTDAQLRSTHAALLKADLKQTKESVALDLTPRLEKWCAQHGVSFAGMMTVVEKRDSYISAFVEVGLNAFANSSAPLLALLQSDRKGALEAIRRIKRCLNDGYGMRMLVKRNGVFSSLLRKVEVQVQHSFAEPFTYLLCNNFAVMRDFKANRFVVKADEFVSVMEDVDETLYI